MPSVFGLDLGQTSDFTALAGLEQSSGPEGNCYAVRYLKRHQLGTPYPLIVTQTEGLLSRPEVAGAPVAVDQTGVGRPVVDMFRASGKLDLRPVTITAGQGSRLTEDGWHVAKKELVSVVQVLLQSRRLTVASGLKEAAVLLKELLNFKVKITAAANETFSAWREGDHDDLVLAVALACWLGEHVFLGAWDVAPHPAARSAMADCPES